jgi:hypothetical protein
LDQELQYLPFTICGAPQIFLPLIETNTSSRCQRVSAGGCDLLSFLASKFYRPAADGFIGDIDATLGQQILDIPKTQRKSEIQPDGILDDLGWKAVAVI